MDIFKFLNLNSPEQIIAAVAVVFGAMAFVQLVGYVSIKDWTRAGKIVAAMAGGTILGLLLGLKGGAGMILGLQASGMVTFAQMWGKLAKSAPAEDHGTETEASTPLTEGAQG